MWGVLTYTRCLPSNIEQGSDSWIGYFDPPMGNHNCAGFMRLFSSGGNSVYFGSYTTSTGTLSWQQLRGGAATISVTYNLATKGKIKVTMNSAEGITYLDVWQLFSNS